MKASEIKALSADQRAKKLAELKEELFNLHFQQAINQLDNPMRIKAVKKDIARIKTVERETNLIRLILKKEVTNNGKKPQKNKSRYCYK